MRYTAKEAETGEIVSIREALEAVLVGLGFELIELAVSKHRGSVQVRAVIYKTAGGHVLGVDDCSRVHRAITPRLELAFPGQDVYLEVSSPGIDRGIRDGAEFAHYRGRGVRCYRTDITDWSAGILESADEKGIVLRVKGECIRLEFDVIAKARLYEVQDFAQAKLEPSLEV
jgi:ribosome maturation factor RimP